VNPAKRAGSPVVIAAMLAGILRGENPVSGTFPVATVLISGAEAGYQSVESLEAKVPVGWPQIRLNKIIAIEHRTFTIEETSLGQRVSASLTQWR
jgi:hypothetical protein